MSISNKIAVWGSTIDEFGSSSYTISGGNTPGFPAGNLIYAQQLNKAFRNATVVPYAIAQMLTGVSYVSSFNIGFDVAPESIGAFASTFKDVFNRYIQSATKVASATLADGAIAFSTARTISLSGPVTGTATSNGAAGWTIATSIGSSKILTDMISDGAITTAKIASGAINASKLAQSAVSTGNIYDGHVTTAKIATNAVTSDKLGTSAVTSAKLSTSAVVTAKISDGAVTNAKISTPFMVFVNGTSSRQVNLGQEATLYNIFGFNVSSSGTIKYTGGPSGFILDPDADGDTISVVPNAFMMSNLNYISGKFPKASIIGSQAFYYCTNLTNVSIPNVEYIGESAFCYCTNLTSVSMPKIKNISSQAFCYCTNLTSIVLSSTLSLIGENAFIGCSNLSKITEVVAITPSLIIHPHAFYNCYNLSSVQLNNVISIGYNAFYNCSALTSISFPNLEYLGSNAFSSTNITGMSRLEFSKLISLGYYPFPSGMTGELIIPNIQSLVASSGSAVLSGSFNLIDMRNLASISANSPRLKYGTSNLISCYINNIEYLGRSDFFANMSSLKTLTTDGTNNLSKLKYIASNVFSNCQALSSIKLPIVESIGPFAFQNCYNLTGTLSLPKIQSMGYNAFYGCSKLTSIVLGSSITSLPATCFSSCIGLTRISYPYITSISANCFYGCTNITQLSLPLVEYIGNYAFYGTAITNMSLPKLKSVYSSPFAGMSSLNTLTLGSECSYMQRITCPALVTLRLQYPSVVSCTSDPLSGTAITQTTGQIYVPTSLVNSYKTATYWSYYSTRFVGF